MMKTKKPTGYILFSKMVTIASKQEARHGGLTRVIRSGHVSWEARHDRITHQAPFIGTINPQDPYAINRAIYARFERPGLTPGSSWGGVLVSNIRVDEVNKTVQWDVAIGIGD